MGKSTIPKTGVTSRRVAAIASRVLNDGKFSIEELKALAASCLNQAGKKILLIAASLLFASCTIKPFVVKTAQGNEIASLGGSVATKSDFEVASIRRVDGAVISYETGRHDETVVPSNYIKAGVLKQAITSAAHSTDVATKAVASKAGTPSGAMGAVPMAAAGIGAAVISRPSSQQIPLPVMEARRDNKKER